MNRIAQVLIERDGLTAEQARAEVASARKALWDALSNGDDIYDFCQDEFGLEPDYLEELIY